MPEDIVGAIGDTDSCGLDCGDAVIYHYNLERLVPSCGVFAHPVKDVVFMFGTEFLTIRAAPREQIDSLKKYANCKPATNLDEMNIRRVLLLLRKLPQLVKGTYSDPWLFDRIDEVIGVETPNCRDNGGWTCTKCLKRNAGDRPDWCWC